MYLDCYYLFNIRVYVLRSEKKKYTAHFEQSIFILMKRITISPPLQAESKLVLDTAMQTLYGDLTAVGVRDTEERNQNVARILELADASALAFLIGG
jgi:hypothetical protein